MKVHTSFRLHPFYLVSNNSWNIFFLVFSLQEPIKVILRNTPWQSVIPCFVVQHSEWDFLCFFLGKLLCASSFSRLFNLLFHPAPYSVKLETRNLDLRKTHQQKCQWKKTRIAKVNSFADRRTHNFTITKNTTQTFSGDVYFLLFSNRI